MGQGVLAKAHINFEAADHRRSIHLERVEFRGDASFVVYDTQSKETFGAGQCPALSARPPYIAVTVPKDRDFTVQNVGDVPIDVSNY